MDITFGQMQSVRYTNYQGKTEIRHIVPERLFWGSTLWHPEPQWFLRAKDMNKGEFRDFAIRDMRPVGLDIIHSPKKD